MIIFSLIAPKDNIYLHHYIIVVNLSLEDVIILDDARK